MEIGSLGEFALSLKPFRSPKLREIPLPQKTVELSFRLFFVNFAFLVAGVEQFVRLVT